MEKNIGAAVQSTHEGESIASARACDWLRYGRILAAIFGADMSEPTRLLTDSLANQKVSNLPSSSSRSRHFLIRYSVIQSQAAEGNLLVLHISDENNPADFLTKSVPHWKAKISTSYVLGDARGARAAKREKAADASAPSPRPEPLRAAAPLDACQATRVGHDRDRYDPRAHPAREERAASRNELDPSRPENMDMAAEFESAGASSFRDGREA